MARPAARLLVAEPDRLQLQLIDMLLSSGAFELTLVESGREALQHLKSQSPDLCLFALDLPDVAGDVICGKVRRVSRLARTPVILIAPQAGEFGLSDQARARARKVGADLVLPRPLGDKNLRNRIQGLLDERETTPKREGFTTVVIEEALDELPNDLPDGMADGTADGMADPEIDGPGSSDGFADAPMAPTTDRRDSDRRGTERRGHEVDETFAAMQKELEMLRVENTQLRRKLQKKAEELENTGAAELEKRVAELERRNRALLDTIEKRGGDDEGRSGLFGRRK